MNGGWKFLIFLLVVGMVHPDVDIKANASKVDDSKHSQLGVVHIDVRIFLPINMSLLYVKIYFIGSVWNLSN